MKRTVLSFLLTCLSVTIAPVCLAGSGGNSNTNLSAIIWPDIPDFYKGIFGWKAGF